jgi:hypothetical protein
MLTSLRVSRCWCRWLSGMPAIGVRDDFVQTGMAEGISSFTQRGYIVVNT